MKAFFGGTFDPIHLGHLNAAVAGCGALRLDFVTLVLSAHPPHRAAPMAAADERWEMLKYAVADDDRLQASDLELQREGPSFTIDTVIALRAAFAEPIVWMFGSDGLATYDTWHRSDELKDHCHLLVFARPGAADDATTRRLAGRRLGGFEVVRQPRALYEQPAGLLLELQAPMLDISATRVRRDIAAGRDVGELLPPRVWTYIKRRELYTV